MWQDRRRLDSLPSVSDAVVIYESPSIMLDRVMLHQHRVRGTQEAGRRSDFRAVCRYPSDPWCAGSDEDQVHLELVQLDMRADEESGLTPAERQTSPGFLIRSSTC